MRDKTTRSVTSQGDRLVRIGAVVFFAGAVATVITVAPLFFGVKPFPLYMFALSMLMAVGFVIAAVGLVRVAGRQRR